MQTSVTCFLYQGMDGEVVIDQKTWGNMEHFRKRLDAACIEDRQLGYRRSNGEVVFMPGWSAFAESSEAARAVTDIGLVWLCKCIRQP